MAQAMTRAVSLHRRVLPGDDAATAGLGQSQGGINPRHNLFFSKTQFSGPKATSSSTLKVQPESCNRAIAERAGWWRIVH